MGLGSSAPPSSSSSFNPWRTSPNLPCLFCKPPKNCVAAHWFGNTLRLGTIALGAPRKVVPGAKFSFLRISQILPSSSLMVAHLEVPVQQPKSPQKSKEWLPEMSSSWESAQQGSLPSPLSAPCPVVPDWHCPVCLMVCPRSLASRSNLLSLAFQARLTSLSWVWTVWCCLCELGSPALPICPIPPPADCQGLSGLHPTLHSASWWAALPTTHRVSGHAGGGRGQRGWLHEASLSRCWGACFAPVHTPQVESLQGIPCTLGILGCPPFLP